jgi:hypothetical protein
MTGIVKRGRPPKLARLRRTQRLQLLLTVEEHRTLNRYAAKHGLDVSEVVRGCLRPLLEDGDRAGRSAAKKGEPR